MRQFHFDFLRFFDFLDRIFFLNCFPNPFIVHSTPSFLFEPNFHFSLVVFCSCGILTLIFCFFFLIFLIWFLEMDFPIHSWSVFGLVFFVVNETSLNCTSGLVLLCFLFYRHNFCYDHDVCFLFLRSCNLNWIACVSSFFALSRACFLFFRVINFLVTRDLPHHSQKWLPHSENDFFFTLIHRDKIKWVYITVIEGYLKAANRRSNKLYRFLIKILKSFLIKDHFFSLSF